MDRDQESPERRVGVDARGQTAYDYAIGVSVFLVVVFGVFAFVPTMFDSAESGNRGQEAITADRAVDALVEGGLATSKTPYHLDGDCLVAFFDGVTDCGFDGTRNTAQNLGFQEHRSVNVTVEVDLNGDGARDRLCWTGTAVERVNTCGASGVPLTAGSSAAQNEQFATATRVARIAGQRVFVVVRVW